MYGFDVKDRGKEIQEAHVELQVPGVESQREGAWEQRRARAAQFLASVDVSMTARRRRRSSGVMW